jgi:hypothetical protein
MELMKANKINRLKKGILDAWIPIAFSHTGGGIPMLATGGSPFFCIG